MSNKEVYEKEKTVDFYEKFSKLYPFEKTIMNKFNSSLNSMKMLDLGVGGGRTTHHFAHRVMEYVGIDYSAQMIDVCKKNFRESNKLSFYTCDARDLRKFESDYFDFILFSCCGLDLLNHEGRLQVLKEAKRVGKHDAFLAFTSHNIMSECPNYKFSYHINMGRIINFQVNLIRSPSQQIISTLTSDTGHTTISYNERGSVVDLYYILPTRQIEQLQLMGYDNIQVVSARNGRIKTDRNKIDSIADERLGYIASIKKSL